MILGINIPEGAKVEIDDDKIFIIFDENKTRRDLWNASFWMWLVKGLSIKEFYANSHLSSKRLEVTYRNKLKLASND